MCNKLKLYYKEIFSYFRRNRLWCWITTLLILELLIYCCLNATPSSSYEQYVADAMPKYSGLLWFILIENLKSSLFTIFLGLLPLGLGVFYGAFMTVHNLITTAKWLFPSVGVKQLFFSTLPHAPFEITAIVLSIIIAALLSKAVTQLILRALTGRYAQGKIRDDLLFVFKSIVLVIVPLICFSALMEVTVSRVVTNLYT